MDQRSPSTKCVSSPKTCSEKKDESASSSADQEKLPEKKTVKLDESQDLPSTSKRCDDPPGRNVRSKSQPDLSQDKGPTGSYYLNRNIAAAGVRRPNKGQQKLVSSSSKGGRPSTAAPSRKQPAKAMYKSTGHLNATKKNTDVACSKPNQEMVLELSRKLTQVETLFGQMHYQQVIDEVSNLKVDQDTPFWKSFYTLHGRSLVAKEKYSDASPLLQQVWDHLDPCENIIDFVPIILQLAQCYFQLKNPVKAIQIINYYKIILPRYGYNAEADQIYKIEKWAKPFLANEYIARKLNMCSDVSLNCKHLLSFLLKFRSDMVGFFFESQLQQKIYGRVPATRNQDVWVKWLKNMSDNRPLLETSLTALLKEVLRRVQGVQDTQISNLINHIDTVVETFPEQNDLITISMAIFKATLIMATGRLTEALAHLNEASSMIVAFPPSIDRALIKSLNCSISLRRFLITVWTGQMATGIQMLSSLCHSNIDNCDCSAWLTRLSLTYLLDTDVLRYTEQFLSPNDFRSYKHQLPASVYYTMSFKVNNDKHPSDMYQLKHITDAESCITAEEWIWLMLAHNSIRIKHFDAMERLTTLLKDRVPNGIHYIEFASTCMKLISIGNDRQAETNHHDIPEISIAAKINQTMDLLMRGNTKQAKSLFETLKSDSKNWPFITIVSHCGKMAALEMAFIARNVEQSLDLTEEEPTLLPAYYTSFV